MADKPVNNIWTKLGLGDLRGNKVFRCAWRALWVGAVAGAGTLAASNFGIVNFSWTQTFVAAGSALLQKAWLVFITEKDAPQ
jgi:hypothetical protein